MTYKLTAALVTSTKACTRSNQLKYSMIRGQASETTSLTETLLAVDRCSKRDSHLSLGARSLKGYPTPMHIHVPLVELSGLLFKREDEVERQVYWRSPGELKRKEEYNQDALYNM